MRVFHTRINGERIYFDLEGPRDGRLRNVEQCDDCGKAEFSVVWNSHDEPSFLSCDECGAHYHFSEV